MIEKFPLQELKNKKTDDIFDQIVSQEKEGFDFGFYWETFGQILDQIKSECDEVQEAFEAEAKDHLEEEIGDLLHAAICLCIFCGYDPHEIVANSHRKFQKRFKKLVHLAKAEGHQTLKGHPMSVLMGYWKRAKIED